MRKIAVIGTGYVGLVQGVVLSEFGMQVTCMDTDHEKIALLNQGEIPIYEPGLQEMMQKNVTQGRLRFSVDIKQTVQQNDIVFIAVGTPANEDGSADLQYVLAVAEQIGQHMNGYKVIVNKSTVPVGTGKRVRKQVEERLRERNAAYTFDIVSNPEFLREGKAVKDCLIPDRVVIGAESETAIEWMKQVYDVLYINQTPFVITNLETAEMIKYASNAFLAVKISYINEMALLADQVGADIQVIAKAMGMDGRISSKFLHAGPGYGGSCFPKDTKAIAYTARQYHEEMMVVEAAIAANQKQKHKTAEKILEQLEPLSGKSCQVGVWGLSFKPDTDDMRDAPAITILELLVSHGIHIRAYCPQGMKEASWRLAHLAEHITYCTNEYEAILECDALLVITEWNQFRGADLEKVKSLMRGNKLFDLRNIYNRQAIQSAGLQYWGTGRQSR